MTKEEYDFLQQVFFELICEKQFKDVDNLLQLINVKAESTDFIVMVLMSTFTARDYLPHRAEIYDRAKEHFIETIGEQETNELLDGLEQDRPANELEKLGRKLFYSWDDHEDLLWEEG